MNSVREVQIERLKYAPAYSTLFRPTLETMHVPPPPGRGLRAQLLHEQSPHGRMAFFGHPCGFRPTMIENRGTTQHCKGCRHVRGTHLCFRWRTDQRSADHRNTFMQGPPISCQV